MAREGLEWWPEDDEVHADLVVGWIAAREEVRSTVRASDEARNVARIDRHNLRSRPGFNPGQLVMLVQEGKPPKLRQRWNGPFRVAAKVGRASYRLVNLDGSMLYAGEQLDYHADSLKVFEPRQGYLRRVDEERLPPSQLLRRARQGKRNGGIVVPSGEVTRG